MRKRRKGLMRSTSNEGCRVAIHTITGGPMHGDGRLERCGAGLVMDRLTL